ncbi:hypothetical protein FB554_1009 [Barrientosiimonas humi]|uniref:DUF5302 domain-containing protein n=2 Tax=Barrientosiimonas TaxID=1535207 RepID=A0A542XAU9_9MICO|nr:MULTISPECIES: DUF5302 domain-containing protein [Barrientosiimonas]TQL32876.1 hypothetical protein FB554_1009 [Barrientosiimonas humi]BDZ57705.1 hypothetical protein GCM10025872_13620 [Barrientosiimonas endolithica]CAG7572867.1 hypothetical protein BH39T_PBIAJDOK_01490 [Barrientosiimonas humi]
MADSSRRDAAGDDNAAQVGPDEETKRKFREALEKKQAHGGRDVSDHSAHSKVAGAHDAETSGAQQMFRRKSGPGS